MSKVIPLLFALALPALAAEDSKPAPSSLRAQLEWTCGEETLLNRYASFTAQKEPFQKEPPVPKSVQRGRLAFGSAAKNAFACLYDSANGRLYLDLNRNADLTDDQPFSRAGQSNEVLRGSQLFKGIRLPLQTAAGQRSLVVDLALFSYGGSQVSHVSTRVRSSWQGKMSFQGRDWQVAVVDDILETTGDNSGPFLVLRPWSDRQQPFSMNEGSIDALKFPTRLYWQGQAWRVTRQDSKGTDSSERCLVEFAAEQPKLGRLSVKGSFLDHVVLEDKAGYTLFLDTFSQTLDVPVGSFHVNRVWIKNGQARASRTGGGQVLVKANAEASLVAGGPLTNFVTISRRGKYLSLNHELVGADQGAYKVHDSGAVAPPDFAIYRDGKKVASGKFSFG